MAEKIESNANNYKGYSEYEKSALTRDIESLDDVRISLLEMAFNYRKTARLYIAMLSSMIIAVIILFLTLRYFGFKLVPSGSENDWMVSAANSTLHIGAVILVIYLSQLLIGFSRYHYRVADKLFSQANGITICQASNELEKLQEFVDCMSLDIDFGKIPTTPTDKILETLSKIQPLKGSNN